MKFRVLVLKCKWVDCNTRVHVGDLAFTLVTNIEWKENPFIMDFQANTFFMLKIFLMKWWLVVVQEIIEHDVHS